MKRQVLVLFFYMAVCVSGLRGQAITLEECQQLAAENYPVVVQWELIEKTTQYNIANARRNWIPQLSVSAQATYQSDVASFPKQFDDLLSLAGISMEGLPRDQYRAAVELQQIIWDGGLIKAQTEIAKAESEVSKGSWEVEMYALRERINSIYFGMMLLQENIKLADLYIDELKRNLRLVDSYVQNGVAGQNDLDKIRVEILSAQQQRSELTSSIKAFRLMLGLMINRELDETVMLAKPEEIAVPAITFDKRPELKVLTAHENVLDAQRKGISAGVMPQIGAFAQFGYGNPGLNLFEDMLKNQWSTFYIVGARLEWKIGGFYTRKNRLAQIELGKAQVDSNRETFLYNMRLKNIQEKMALERMLEVMREDERIIELRSSIRSRTEKQVENGTATVSDLLREITEENAALRNKVTHEIEMLKNLYDIKFTTNN